ncbi:MAG: TetR/AcrR family transcriptional regulator [Reichenbachiella sp.]
MTEIKNKILLSADSQFHRYGIRSVSMDDIARELKMSKKTIYQYFKDKDEIVKMVSSLHIEREKNEFEEVLKTAENALEEIFKLSKCLRKNMSEINPSLLFDIQKFHPSSWTLWEEFKNEFIRNAVLRVIARGKKEGFFRKGLNAEVLATLRIETIEMTFNQNIFPKAKFDFTEVQLTLLDHFVHGLLTIKGQEIYDEMTNSIAK